MVLHGAYAQSPQQVQSKKEQLAQQATPGPIQPPKIPPPGRNGSKGERPGPPKTPPSPGRENGHKPGDPPNPPKGDKDGKKDKK
jgi:hypothetical protein